jgi:hypothetical protein
VIPLIPALGTVPKEHNAPYTNSCTQVGTSPRGVARTLIPVAQPRGDCDVSKSASKRARYGSPRRLICVNWLVAIVGEGRWRGAARHARV